MGGLRQMKLTHTIITNEDFKRIQAQISLIMGTITSHIFINIFQMGHFSAVKFIRGYRKYKFAFDTKISESFKIKNKKI